MKAFDFMIQDTCGLHARPAGCLASFAKEYADTAITVQAKGQSVNLSDIVPLLRLGLRSGDSITFCVEGNDEEMISRKLKTLAANTL